MQKLALFLDGTWNNDKEKDGVTNIVRLRDLVRAKWAAADGPEPYYDAGVGTRGVFDKVAGGALGFGLSSNVRDAYRYLSQHYRPGDDIHLFGFSRGAFTARSLAGFVGASGLLRKEALNEENVTDAWDYYRTPPDRRRDDPEARVAKARLETLCHPGVRIRFLGVFDTVGALGVPLWSAGNWAGALDRFHDTKLGRAVDFAFHAVAIDEHRGPYVPTLWAKPDHGANKDVQQVWFPGVHSDVGGGRDRSADAALGRTHYSDLSLAWMISRLKAHAPGLPVGDFAIPAAPRPGVPRDYYGWFFYSRAVPMIRLIEGTALKPPFARQHHTFRLDPPEVSCREFLHASALALMADGGLEKPYRPPNLVSVVPLVRSGALKVVGYDGNEVPPAQVSALLAALPADARAAEA